ncbi:MAG: TetR family transcriptional regulator [Verrucomicrobiota bacterium]
MKRTIVPNTGSKLRLLEAAEKLFAEHGFDVVSVRDITQAAGGNVAAVNYHFGSRDGLVELVMTRYLMPVHEERLARLDAAEQKWAGQVVPIEELVYAFVRPLITQVEKSELSEQLFYRLVGRIFGSHGHDIPAPIEVQMSVLIKRFTQSLSKSLPMVAEEDLVWRLHFVMGAMIYMLTHGEAMQRLSQGAAGNPGMKATLERFVRFAVAGLRDGVGSPPPQQTVARAGQAPDGGHGPPLQHDDDPHTSGGEAVATAGHDGGILEARKPGKKKPQKTVQDSPQVMFEF